MCTDARVGSGSLGLLTQRLPAQVLVVEGWIGREGVRAAAAEFDQRGYQYVVVTTGLTADGREEHRGSFAEMAKQELIRLGISEDRIIFAPACDAKGQRTYGSAVAVWRALQRRGIRPKALNVFTLGPHARRSRLVFAKVYGVETQVGVVAWIPSDYGVVPWWRSSGRTKCLLKETIGYPFEILLNSGRSSNSLRWTGSPAPVFLQQCFGHRFGRSVSQPEKTQ